MELLISVGVIALSALLLILFTRRFQNGAEVHLRPLDALKALEGHVGEAIESGSQLHLSLGQAGLASVASPTSIAALSVLDHLAKDGCANGTPPLVTVGDPTLLPAGQESLRHAYVSAKRTGEYRPGLVQFVASETDAFAYAGGVASVIQQEKIVSNVLVGRFGPELAIMSEAASRKNIGQVVGSDDPVALALATAVTENVLIGEELLATAAYLEGSSAQLASLRAQDVLRLIAMLVILGSALFQMFGG